MLIIIWVRSTIFNKNLYEFWFIRENFWIIATRYLLHIYLFMYTLKMYTSEIYLRESRFFDMQESRNSRHTRNKFSSI